MRWPPNKSWTSTCKREGYRHFLVTVYGGKGLNRWVELSPVNNDAIRFRVSLEALNDLKEWTTGWLQLPKEDSNSKTT